MMPMEKLTSQEVPVNPDMDAAIGLIKDVATWMNGVGLVHNEWWHPDNMNSEFFGQYASPDEFFVAKVDEQPAAAAIIQPEQTLQDWSSVDGDSHPPALYIHYVAVERSFAGRGLPGILLRHAEDLARQRGIPVLRLDTNADQPKLRRIYEDAGFEAVRILQEEHGNTVLYEKQVSP